MKSIFTGLAPNLQYDDARLALSLIFKPWKYNIGDYIYKIEDAFREYIGTKFAFSFVSGRGALVAILKAFNLGRNDDVLLQAYTCVAVPNCIKFVGANPVYVDIDKRTFNMSIDDLEKRITPKSKAIIIQHTFGNPANIRDILAFARANNLIVIEDCAHALGTKCDNKLVGSFGDAAFFSFGRDKVISSVFGGIAITNNENAGQKLKEIYNTSKFPSIFWTFRQLLYQCLMYILKKTFDFFIGKCLIYLFNKLGIFSKALFKKELRGKMPFILLSKFPNALAKAAMNQFNKLELFNDHRKKIASIYNDCLKNSSYILLINENNNCIYTRYIIRHEKMKEILLLAKKNKIYLGDWYNESIAPKGVIYDSINFTEQEYPNAKSNALSSFNLPTDINISPDDAKRIVNFLLTYDRNQSN